MRISTIATGDFEVTISKPIILPVLAKMTGNDMKVVSKLFTTVLINDETQKVFIKQSTLDLLKDLKKLTVDGKEYDVEAVKDEQFLEMIQAICSISQERLGTASSANRKVPPIKTPAAGPVSRKSKLSQMPTTEAEQRLYERQLVHRVLIEILRQERDFVNEKQKKDAEYKEDHRRIDKQQDERKRLDKVVMQEDALSTEKKKTLKTEKPGKREPKISHRVR